MPMYPDGFNRVSSSLRGGSAALPAPALTLDMVNSVFTLNGSATTISRHIASAATGVRYGFDGATFTSFATGVPRTGAAGIYGESAIVTNAAYPNDASNGTWGASSGFAKGTTKGTYGPCQRIAITCNTATANMGKGCTHALINNLTANVPVYVTLVYEAGVGGKVSFGIQQNGIVQGADTNYSPTFVNGTVGGPLAAAGNDFTYGGSAGMFSDIISVKLFGNVYMTTAQFTPQLSGAHLLTFGPGSGTVGDSVDLIYFNQTDKRCWSVIPGTTTAVTSLADNLTAQNELLSMLTASSGAVRLSVDLINTMPGGILDTDVATLSLLTAGVRDEAAAVVGGKTYTPLLPGPTDLASTPTSIMITWDPSGGQVVVGNGKPVSFAGAMATRTAVKILQGAQGRIRKIEAWNTRVIIPDVPTSKNTWKDVHLGGGGYITTVQFADDGTEIASIDVYGAYVRQGEASPWEQIVTQTSMPVGDVDLLKNAGAFGATISKTNPNRAYMVYRGFVYRTDNLKSSSRTWTKTALAQFNLNEADSNQTNRIYGRRINCDPNNQDHVIVAMPSGVWRSTNAGASWAQLTALGTTAAAGTQHLGFSIAFDRSVALVGGFSGTVYVSKAGVGVFRSVDGGATYTQISDGAGLGGPNTHAHTECGPDGVFWVAPNAATSTVWQYKASTWASVVVSTGTGKSVVAIAADPTNGQTVVAVNNVGCTSVTKNGGTTWSNYGTTITRDARKLPWHKWAYEFYFAIAEAQISPISGLIHLAEGLGVWTLNPSAVSQSSDWTELSDGIEELVANCPVPLASGAFLFCSLDRAFFRRNDLDQYPYTHGVNNLKAIVAGFHAAQSPVNNNFVVGIANTVTPVVNHQSGYSLDEGKTWTTFATMPPAVINNGCIAGSIVAGPLGTVLWWPSINGVPYRSTDYGATWSTMTFPGLTQTIGSDNGWGSTSSQKKFIACADWTTLGTVYCYNSKNGLYKSTDWGVTWVLMTGALPTGWTGNTKLKCNPWNGTLFFSGGAGGASTLVNASTSATNGLRTSTNGGTSFSVSATAVEAWDIDFGAPRIPGGFADIVMIGYVGNVFGHWRSSDNMVTWTQLGQFPKGSIDNVSVIGGSRTIPGRYVVGRQGSGYVYIDAV